MREPLTRLAVAAATALLAACGSMAPPYERPPLPVDNAWSAAAGTVPAAGAFGPADWTGYFTDPQLARLVDTALANNRDLRVAAANIAQARAQFQVRRADQFPTVNAALSGSRAPVGNGNSVESYTAGLAISAYELDVFGRIASLKDAALAQYLATAEAQRAVQVALVAGVASGWLALLADNELVDLARRTIATREDSVRLSRLRFDAGATSELDFRQAESLAEAARATLAQLLRQRAQDEHALVLLLGSALPADLQLPLATAPLSAQPPFAVPPPGLPSDLLAQRPDIRQAEQQLVAANANIGAARAAFFPRIALTVGVGSASTELSGLFRGGSWGWTLAPQLLLPIFDAGRNQAGLDGAFAVRDAATAQYERAIQVAFREVNDALAGQATLGDQLAALERQQAAEAVRLNLSDLRYRNGVASYLDLLDAQRSLFAVQQAVLQTRLAQRQNQVQLYRALGGGWSGAGAAPP